MSVLSVTDLTVDIETPNGTLRVVDGVGFEAEPGEALSLLGESGCGRSMTAQAIVGLLEPVASFSRG